MLKIYSNCLSRFIDLYLKKIIREYALILIAVTLLSVTEISSYIVLQNLVSLTPQMHSITLQIVKKKNIKKLFLNIYKKFDRVGA